MTDLDTTLANSSDPSDNDMKARAEQLLSRFTKGQRVAGVLVVLAVVAGVFFMSRLADSAQFAPLFTDLSSSDAAAITEQLDSEGIPYQLAEAGRTIMVPSNQVYAARLKVAANGVPSDSSVGYGVLDNQGLTTSEFGQRVGFQRAMEGELSTTIEALDVVQVATVHLALPNDSAFALSDRKASASVLVRTRPGTQMTDEQVQSVVNLVASSIQHLSPGDVTVADSEGNVLAAPGRSPSGGGGGGSNARRTQTEMFERKVASSIEDMLTRAVGPGAATATVSAELDFDETNVSRETFEAPATGADGEPLAIQDSTRNETFSGTGGAVAGVLGPDTPANGVGGGDTDYSLEEADVQYALNRVVESTNTAPGAITKLSVAVMVDENKVGAEVLASLEGLVAAAAGVDAERGDVLAIDRVPFDTSLVDRAEEEMRLADEAEAAAATREMIQTIVLAVMLLIVLLVAAFLYRRGARQRRKRAELLTELQLGALPRAAATQLVPAAQIAASVQDLGPESAAELDMAPAGLAAGPDPALQPAGALASGAAGHPASGPLALQAQIGDMAEQQPAEVAQLMRGWLDDGRGGGA